MLRQALFPSSFLTHELGTDFLFTLKTEKPFKQVLVFDFT